MHQANSLAGAHGVEPRYAGSEPAALPLCYTPIMKNYLADFSASFIISSTHSLTLADIFLHFG